MGVRLTMYFTCAAVALNLICNFELVRMLATATVVFSAVIRLMAEMSTELPQCMTLYGNA